MKNILTVLSTLVLGTTGIIPGIANTTTSVQPYQKILIQSPKDTLLTTAGDWGTARREWSYVTINLGSLRQEQITNISSSYSNSYTEHKVADYDYHYGTNHAGIDHYSDFRGIFFEGAVTSDWSYYDATRNSENNFSSLASSGLATQFAEGTIKFMWHYDGNNNLLVDIVGALYVGAELSSSKGVASIKLGTSITINYN